MEICKYCGTEIIIPIYADMCVYCDHIILAMRHTPIDQLKRIMADHCKPERITEIEQACRDARYRLEMGGER